MKKGCGEKNDKLESWMSFMLGLLSIPYVWAAKSTTKLSGASHRAVECEIPMMLDYFLDLLGC